MMISATAFRNNFTQVLSTALKTNATLYIVYKGTVYEVTLRATDLKPKLRRNYVKKVKGIDLEKVDIDTCPRCHNVRFNKICSNTVCGTEKPRS